MSSAPLTPASCPRLASGVRAQRDPVSGEVVLLYPEGIAELNETAGEIASRCDGTATAQEIATILAAEYDAPPEDLLADVLACLEDLRQRQLLTVA